MRNAANVFISNYALAMIAATLSDIFMTSSDTGLLVAIIILLIATIATVAVSKQLEVYSVILCSISMLVALVGAIMPTEGRLLNLAILSGLVPAIMVLMENGQESSVLWKMAYTKGCSDGVTNLTSGKRSSTSPDVGSVGFLRQLFERVQPDSAQEARQYASTYQYTDKKIVDRVFADYQTDRVIAIKKEQAKQKRTRVQANPGGYKGGGGGIPVGGHKIGRNGGF